MALFPCLLLLVYSAASYADDPCNSYTLLDDVHRSSHYVMGDTEEGICDMGMQDGWYRFNSSAGSTMPTTRVDMNHCGTSVPIWMKGSLPSVSDGNVERTACANFGTQSDGCGRFLTINVTNCKDYYVYHLYPTPACPIAYCAGNLKTCPFGTWSPNGLEPNCKDIYPKVSTNPILEGPTVINNSRSFVFTCEMEYADDDVDQEFQVAWTADGVAFYNETLSFNSTVAVLDGSLLGGHMNSAIGCKIRSGYKTGPNVYSPWLESSVYRAEIKVDPTHIVIDENGTDQTVTLTSTIPVVCANKNIQACVLSIQLDANGPEDSDVFTESCVFKLKSSDWDNTTNTVSSTITTVASSDKLDDGDKQLILSFRDMFSFGDPYQSIFHEYQVPSIQVVVKDSPARQCVMTGDPHITGFKGNYFHLFGTGVYTMYNKTSGDDDFQLQIHTYPCNTDVSCICGVAMRENDDVIRTDFCGNLRATPTIDIPKTLRQGTIINSSTDGTSMVIYFPSGREVKIDTNSWKPKDELINYNNVYLAVPANDLKGTTNGICGTLDTMKPNDQYGHRNGIWERACVGQPPKECIPRLFEESWRLELADSWFMNLPPQKNNEPDYIYCQCRSEATNEPVKVNCSVAADFYVRMTLCSGTCKPIPGTRSFRRRSLAYDDEDEQDPLVDTRFHVVRKRNFGWPVNGTSESQARNLCLQKLQNSQLWSNCHQSSSIVDTNVQSCVTDILYTRSFAMMESALTAFTSQCQSELSLDIRNYAPGQTEMRAELTSEICSTLCLRNGHCDGGKCVCDTGYVGDNCQLDGTKGPQLLHIRGPKYCDTNERPCRKIFFDAENFQMGDGFICKSQEVLENGEISTEMHFEEAVFINSIRLACIIPDARTKIDKWIKTFSVSATFDGNQYGNSLNVTAYDSTCQSCNDTTGCVRKPNTCLIDDLCYLDGDWKPGYNTRRCMVSHSNDSWSRVSPCTGEVVAPDWTLDKCLINNVCYDDGVYKASDLTRRCMLSLSNHSWTPVSPCTGDVVGPDWTVFQRRYTGSEDFYRDWNEYVAGFGHNDGEFWMGLEPLHQLTSSGSYELRVDLKDWNNVTASASYSNFSIGGAADNYMMYYSQFIGGDAGDSLSKHQHMPFSTKDADHDLAFTGSCADWYHGGWWYNACQDANLNGKYVIQNVNNARDGIEWKTFRSQGRSMKCTEMRVRPTPAGTSGNLLG